MSEKVVKLHPKVGVFTRLFAAIRDRLERNAAKRSLYGMSDHLLEDIGVGRHEIDEMVEGSLRAGVHHGASVEPLVVTPSRPVVKLIDDHARAA